MDLKLAEQSNGRRSNRNEAVGPDSLMQLLLKIALLKCKCHLQLIAANNVCNFNY